MIELIRHPLLPKLAKFAYRWNPFREKYQWWDAVNLTWVDSNYLNRDINDGLYYVGIIDYEDTWAEPEKDL